MPLQKQLPWRKKFSFIGNSHFFTNKNFATLSLAFLRPSELVPSISPQTILWDPRFLRLYFHKKKRNPWNCPPKGTQIYLQGQSQSLVSNLSEDHAAFESFLSKRHLDISLPTFKFLHKYFWYLWEICEIVWRFGGGSSLSITEQHTKHLQPRRKGENYLEPDNITL